MSISNQIARVDKKGKILDIREKLSLATMDHYAEVVGTGGSKGTTRACFGLYLTDYSKGTGEKAVSVSLNIDPAQVAVLLQSASFNISCKSAGLSTVGAKADIDVKPAIAAARALMKGGTVSEDKKTISVDYNKLVALGKQLVELDAAAAADNPSDTASEFCIKQDKVDVYKEEKGFAPVSRLLIKRQADYKLPWFISMTTGTGKVQKTEIGGSYFTDFKATASASINISDLEMFELMFSAQRAYDAFIISTGSVLFKNGKKEYGKEIKASKEGGAENG